MSTRTETNRTLVRRWRAGDASALDQLIANNQALVWQAALRVAHDAGRGADQSLIDDLVQEGTLGLLGCLRTYDPEAGALSTYASQPIHQRVRRYLQSRAGVIDVPIRIFDRDTRNKPDDVAAAHRARWGVSDGRWDDGTDGLRQVPAPEGEDLDERLDRQDQWDRVWAKVRRLRPQQREVIVRRYGLEGQPPETYPEIARGLGVSKQYAGQVERAALDTLRQRLAIKGATA